MSDNQFCTVCGNAIRPGAKFCNVCGSPVSPAQSAASSVPAGVNNTNIGADDGETQILGSFGEEKTVVPEKESMPAQASSPVQTSSAVYASAPVTLQQPVQTPVKTQAPAKNQTPVNAAEQSKVVPAENRPVGMWGYFGLKLLLALPIVGFILTFVLAFAPKNVNIKNFVRSRFCEWIIMAIPAIALIVFLLITGMSFTALFDNISGGEGILGFDIGYLLRSMGF